MRTLHLPKLTMINPSVRHLITSRSNSILLGRFSTLAKKRKHGTRSKRPCSGSLAWSEEGGTSICRYLSTLSDGKDMD